ncbi:MAG: hypothetical protein WCH04_02735 [Gammaproteobacteria bacterium]
MQATPRVQVLEGRISSGSLQFYRISGLTRGARLYVHAEATTGHLDPLIALLRPDAGLEALSRESLNEQIKVLSRDDDPLEVTRQIMDRVFAGDAFVAEMSSCAEQILRQGNSKVDRSGFQL